MVNFKSAGVTLAGFMLVAVACNAGATPAPPTAAPVTAAPVTAAPVTAAPATEAPAKYTLGFSNAFGVGNGFREEQLCTAKAQALVSGEVGASTWTHAEDSTYPQLQQLRDLIQQSPDAIIFNPNSPDGYQDVLDEAQAAGIKTVAIDAYVTDPETLNINNDQYNYGYIGATWLFDKVLENADTANVYYMRGIVGHPADLDRHQGVMQALEEHPGITLLPTNEGVDTGWNPDKGTELTNGIINDGTYDTIDGIWTSGIDQQVVDAIQVAGKDFVPIVGADLKGFVEQLLNKKTDNNPDGTKYTGLEGLAVYNPAAIGGAGVKLALDALNGITHDTTTLKRTTADGVEHDIKVTLLPKPLAYDNTTADGMAKLAEIDVDGLNVLWPVSWYIDGWTDYTVDQMLACKGPGE